MREELEMNFQDIKYFYEVSKTGNLSYAALNLNVTQPTITKQLKLLSKELGHPLYTRTSKGVVLTNAGKVLLNRAEDLLAIEEAIKKELSTVRGNMFYAWNPQQILFNSIDIVLNR